MFSFIGTRNRKKLTLIEISELWLKSKKFSVKLSTYCNYKQKLEDYIYPQLGSLKYSEISQTQLNDFIDYLLVSGRKDGKGGLSKGTVKDIITLMKSISKFAHIHFVCNEEAKRRLMQLGESEHQIYVIGSPDIDIMLSNHLPTFEEARERYEIPFEKYGILMYHPVTTEYEIIGKHVEELVNAVKESGRNYIVIYPNNDLGSEVILNAYRTLADETRYRLYPSTRFEYFLTLLKNADFMIGNSSAGVRETSIYGIPAIDVGTRQKGRYSTEYSQNIQHVSEDKDEILQAIEHIEDFRKQGALFGKGNSTKQFLEIVHDKNIWEHGIQKVFIDRWG